MISDEKLREELKKDIIGQDRAVEAVVKAVVVAAFGACDPTAPLGTFLMLGPTGVGKSQMGRSLAKILHGDDDKAVVVNCTEFKNYHDVAKLTGAPPGYVGHEQPPFLTPEQLQGELTVVIFEELEKADRALYDLLLQVLWRGELKTGRGVNLNFRHCLIFMTSNVGSKAIKVLINKATMGFIPPQYKFAELGEDEADSLIYRKALDEAEEYFSPEFLNRFDNILVFNRLKEEHLVLILDKFLLGVRARLAIGGLGTTITDAAKKFLICKGTNFVYGARPLRRAIRDHLEFPMVAKYQRQADPSGISPDIHIDLDKSGEKLNFTLRKQRISGSSKS